MPIAVNTAHWYIITGIDVLGSNKSVVAFGDSVTDGRGLTTNAQNRWTNCLASRLQANDTTSNVGVLSQGIGGTLVMGSGISRFDNDVLEQSGARYLIILYGINDIVYASADATRLINTYKTFIRKAHPKNILVYGGTLLPFGCNSAYTAAKETVRQAVNTWIRSTRAADGGFDAVLILMPH